MKLIAILFLYSKLLPAFTREYNSEEVDCNDEDVFKAVDTALKKYNDRNQTGNQFVLYRITEVTKMENNDTFYFVKYEIKEGDCPVQSGKTWQDCDYQDSEKAATGVCTATVRKKNNVKFSVATQTCQITPAVGPVVTSEYNCLGCMHPISTASPELEPILTHAIQHFNNKTDRSHLFSLKEVKSAQRQVVSGLNYEVTYTIAQTNCSKENFLFLTPDCMSLPNGESGECTDHAYIDLQENIASFSQKCDLFPAEEFGLPIGVCVGCPTEISVDSPQLQEPLKHSITKLNAEHNGLFYFKIDTVTRATTQVVAGAKYSIEFTARETTCSKQSNKELTESCEISTLGQALDCNAEVIVVPWMDVVETTVSCKPLGKTSLLKRPPGFSPFRSVQAEGREEGTTVSPPHISMAPVQDEEQDSGQEQGPARAHGWAHGEQTKHDLGHGHRHEHDQGHGHQREHGIDHGHKHEQGHGHRKHKNKGKNNGKHSGWRTEHLASSSEDSATSAQTQEKTERSTSLPSLAQPGIAITFPNFQDSDLIAAAMTIAPPTPTENDDAWIPDIQTEPNSHSFNQISDFPENSPKCPGRPWKPVNGMNPTVEMKKNHDFDLSDALYYFMQP